MQYRLKFCNKNKSFFSYLDTKKEATEVSFLRKQESS
jgi:hypothetical protein